MDKDTDVSLELTDDEHPDAEAAAEDTARRLLEVRDRRDGKDEEPNSD